MSKELIFYFENIVLKGRGITADIKVPGRMICNFMSMVIKIKRQ